MLVPNSKLLQRKMPTGGGIAYRDFNIITSRFALSFPVVRPLILGLLGWRRTRVLTRLSQEYFREPNIWRELQQNRLSASGGILNKGERVFLL